MTSAISSSPRAEGFSVDAISTASLSNEIEPRHRIMRSWNGRLFFYAENFAGFIEFHNTVSFRVLHMAAEDEATCVSFHCPLKNIVQTISVKDIVTQDETYVIPAINSSL